MRLRWEADRSRFSTDRAKLELALTPCQVSIQNWESGRSFRGVNRAGAPRGLSVLLYSFDRGLTADVVQYGDPW